MAGWPPALLARWLWVWLWLGRRLPGWGGWGEGVDTVQFIKVDAPQARPAALVDRLRAFGDAPGAYATPRVGGIFLLALTLEFCRIYRKARLSPVLVPARGGA